MASKRFKYYLVVTNSMKDKICDLEERVHEAEVYIHDSSGYMPLYGILKGLKVENEEYKLVLETDDGRKEIPYNGKSVQIVHIRLLNPNVLIYSNRKLI